MKDLPRSRKSPTFREKAADRQLGPARSPRSGCPRSDHPCGMHPHCEMSRGVAEWQARKTTRASDPFVSKDALSEQPVAPGVGAATAVVAGRVVASSTRIQRANQRVYFPIADCVAAAFELSDKRWR